MSALANENKTIQQLLEEEKEEFKLEIAGYDKTVIPSFFSTDVVFENRWYIEKRCSLELGYAVVGKKRVFHRLFLASLCLALYPEDPVFMYGFHKKNFTWHSEGPSKKLKFPILDFGDSECTNTFNDDYNFLYCDVKKELRSIMRRKVAFAQLDKLHSDVLKEEKRERYEIEHPEEYDLFVGCLLSEEIDIDIYNFLRKSPEDIKKDLVEYNNNFNRCKRGKTEEEISLGKYNCLKRMRVR